MPKSSPIRRRGFLKSAAATLALPSLESVLPRHASAALAVADDVAHGKNLVCIGNTFGMVPGYFFPKETGRDYKPTRLLEPMESHRQDFSIFSNLDHGLKGGHFTVHTFLSGVRSVDAKSMPDGNITVDQRAAEVLSGQTRFPSLTIGSEGGIHGGTAMSWTRTGVRVPPIKGPRELFRKLFVNEDAEGKKKAASRLDLEGSILDAVLPDAKRLSGRLSGRDREKLDEFFTSVRDVERRIELNSHWNGVAKPAAPGEEPLTTGEYNIDLPELYDLVALALETGSTRVATLELAGVDFKTSAFGLKKGYHSLSHHGQREDYLRDLLVLEDYQMEQFARFLDRLKSTSLPDSDASLLDTSMVLFGSGMGDASSHSNINLPTILAGGGFAHEGHRAFPREKPKRVPFCNLLLSLLQEMGVEDARFGTSDGTLPGLARA